MVEIQNHSNQSQSLELFINISEGYIPTHERRKIEGEKKKELCLTCSTMFWLLGELHIPRRKCPHLPTGSP